MSKTPDEIKKGLECCLGDTHAYHCDECPYADDESEVDDGCGDNGIQLLEDALVLVQQLEAENKQHHQENTEMYSEMCMLREKVHRLEAERDELKEALGLMVYQYCVRGDKLDHMYMCAGETAFRVLGLEQYGNTSSLENWLFPEFQEREE